MIRTIFSLEHANSFELSQRGTTSSLPVRGLVSSVERSSGNRETSENPTWSYGRHMQAYDLRDIGHAANERVAR